MGKSVRRSGRKEESQVQAGQPQGVAGVVLEAREALRELVLNAGFAVFAELLEEDREALYGPRYARDGDREGYRHGSEVGHLVFGGMLFDLARPTSPGSVYGSAVVPGAPTPTAVVSLPRHQGPILDRSAPRVAQPSRLGAEQGRSPPLPSAVGSAAPGL